MLLDTGTFKCTSAVKHIPSSKPASKLFYKNLVKHTSAVPSNKLEQKNFSVWSSAHIHSILDLKYTFIPCNSVTWDKWTQKNLIIWKRLHCLYWCLIVPLLRHLHFTWVECTCNVYCKYKNIYVITLVSWLYCHIMHFYICMHSKMHIKLLHLKSEVQNLKL